VTTPFPTPLVVLRRNQRCRQEFRRRRGARALWPGPRPGRAGRSWYRPPDLLPAGVATVIPATGSAKGTSDRVRRGSGPAEPAEAPLTRWADRNPRRPATAVRGCGLPESASR